LSWVQFASPSTASVMTLPAQGCEHNRGHRVHVSQGHDGGTKPLTAYSAHRLPLAHASWALIDAACTGLSNLGQRRHIQSPNTHPQPSSEQSESRHPTQVCTAGQGVPSNVTAVASFWPGSNARRVCWIRHARQYDVLIEAPPLPAEWTASMSTACCPAAWSNKPRCFPSRDHS
jgi:hypothetical protein